MLNRAGMVFVFTNATVCPHPHTDTHAQIKMLMCEHTHSDVHRMEDQDCGGEADWLPPPSKINMEALDAPPRTRFKSGLKFESRFNIHELLCVLHIEIREKSLTFLHRWAKERIWCVCVYACVLLRWCLDETMASSSGSLGCFGQKWPQTVTRCANFPPHQRAGSGASSHPPFFSSFPSCSAAVRGGSQTEPRGLTFAPMREPDWMISVLELNFSTAAAGIISILHLRCKEAEFQEKSRRNWCC